MRDETGSIKTVNGRTVYHSKDLGKREILNNFNLDCGIISIKTYYRLHPPLLKIKHTIYLY